MSVKKYIPNILSTIRLGMACALPIVFLNTSLLTTLIFYLAGDVTDALDGFLARRWKVQSRYGKIVDPIADKMLNGLALILTSILINPSMLVLTAFEALIAATTIGRFKNNKNASVSQIGRVKTVALFFTIVSSFVSAMEPSLILLTNILIGTTASLETVTAVNYLKDLHQLKKANNKEIAQSPIGSINDKEKEVEHLKEAKEKLNVLSERSKQQKVNKQMNCEPVYDIIIEQEPIIENKEDLGVSKTLKK